MGSQFPKLDTVHDFVDGEREAAAVAATLICRSQWFEVEPYPEDRWRFTVKAEAGHILTAAIEAGSK